MKSLQDNCKWRLQDIETMVNTNVLAASLLVRLFCNGMLDRNRGHIINISSIAAKQRYPGETRHLILTCPGPTDGGHGSQPCQGL